MGSASSRQELVREFPNANLWQRSRKEVSIRPLGKGEVRMCRNVDRKQDMRGWDSGTRENRARNQDQEEMSIHQGEGWDLALFITIPPFLSTALAGE